jgi:uncharacterized small protein (DUF1192 family)
MLRNGLLHRSALLLHVGPTMDPDDLRPKVKSAGVMLGEPLGSSSIPELEERLQALADERARIEAEISVKRRAKDAAAAIFKS